MLSIHSGLRELSKTNVYELHLLKMHLFDISKPYINIENSELLFEQNIIALKRDKYYIEVRDDDTIKRKRISFDFMQQTLNRMDGLYMDDKFILKYTIKISIEEAECRVN